MLSGRGPEVTQCPDMRAAPRPRGMYERSAATDTGRGGLFAAFGIGRVLYEGYSGKNQESLFLAVLSFEHIVGSITGPHLEENLKRGTF